MSRVPSCAIRPVGRAPSLTRAAARDKSLGAPGASGYRLTAVEERRIPRLGRAVSCIGFGAWQLGGGWGDVPESAAIAAVEAALHAGVTFIDTTYGDGRVYDKLVRPTVHSRW